MRVLVLEDDDDLRGAVSRRLRAAGFAVDEAADLPDAATSLAVHEYDCLVFDRTTPSGDALDLLARIRDDGLATPALFLTARDGVDDRVAGFEAGGDDYLTKPFAMEELVARVRSLCRRRAEVSPPQVAVSDLVLDIARQQARRSGVLLPLRQKELCILEHLLTAQGRVVSRTELIEGCWDELHDPMSNVVDVHVTALRRKLGDPAMIRTVRGAGYIVDVDEH
jgi:DNA-binding response OmpR family regulator